jgi:hypothetical protein
MNHDSILDVLARLRASPTDPARVERVRERCHRALERQRASDKSAWPGVLRWWQKGPAALKSLRRRASIPAGRLADQKR